MIGQKKIKHKLKLSKIIIIIAVLFILYMLAIFSPIVLLSFRITELGDLCNANSYAVNNSTSPDDVNVEQSKELYQYLTSTDLKIYTMFSYLSSNHNSAKIPIYQSYANEAFFELNSFNFKEGQAFDKNTFSHKTNDIIPIIVGYNVQELYQYGKVYDVEAFGSSKLFKAKVVGVLEKGSNYIAHWLRKVELDNACIIPITEDFAVNYFTYPDYDMFFSRMVIQTDEPEMIVDKIEEFESLNLKLIPLDDVISERMSRFVSTFVSRLIIGLIVCAVIFILILIKRKYFSHKQ